MFKNFKRCRGVFAIFALPLFSLAHLNGVCAAGVASASSPSYASAAPRGGGVKWYRYRHQTGMFSVPPSLATQVRFWRDIYTKYDEGMVVFHDRDRLDIVYSCLDVSGIVKNENLTDHEKAKLKEEAIEGELKRIQEKVHGVASSGGTVQDAEAVRLYKLAVKAGDGDIERALQNIRSQTGVAEKFRAGIKTSGRYMAEIEKILKEEGVPPIISRLIFVESMFDLNAVSKSGAAGIWQLMPETGRKFIRVDEVVDERLDPIAATRAAAAHLMRDFRALGNWELAINAYNTGPQRMKAAVAQLGTTDISRIIKEFKHPGYGFASRNFYPAFLAAIEVFENRVKYFGDIKMDPPLEFDVVTLRFPIEVPDIVSRTGIGIDVIKELNPHIREGVLSGRLELPAGFTLRVPKGKGREIQARL